MLHKGLWFQHYRQGKYVLWGLWLVALYGIAKWYSHAEFVVEQMALHAKYPENGPYKYFFSAGLETVSFMQIALCIGLATIWGGFSRTNQSLEFTYAMPVKRLHIYLSQWLMGVIHIAGSVTLGFAGQLIVLHTTILETNFSWELFGVYYIHQLLTMIGVLTFSIWVGLLCGSFISQFLCSGILLFLPAVLYSLSWMGLYLHQHAIGIQEELWSGKYTMIFEQLSFPVKMVEMERMFDAVHNTSSKEYLEQIALQFHSAASFLIPIAVTLLCLWGIGVLSKRSSNEHNGKILLKPSLQRFFLLGVMGCSFLLGGDVMGELFIGRYYGSDKTQQEFVQHLLVYYACGALSVGIAYAIAKKLLGTRLLLGK